MTRDFSSDRWTLLAFVVMVLVAGGNAVGIHVAVDELPPFWAAAMRFTVAGALFGLLALMLRVPMPAGRALVGAVMVLAAAHGLERLRLRPIIGAAIAAAGVALLVADRTAADIPIGGILLALGAALCFAETGVVVKLMPRAHPVATNAVGMLVGGLLLGVLSLVAGETWRLPSQSDTWTAMVFLVLGGSMVVFGLYLFILSRWKASTVSIEFLLIPLATVPYSAVLTAEPITPILLVAAGTILLGVYIGAYGTPNPDHNVT